MTKLLLSDTGLATVSFATLLRAPNICSPKASDSFFAEHAASAPSLTRECGNDGASRGFQEFTRGSGNLTSFPVFPLKFLMLSWTHKSSGMPRFEGEVVRSRDVKKQRRW